MQITYSGGSTDYFLETFGATDPGSVTESRSLVTFSDAVSGFYTELSGTRLASVAYGTITGIDTDTADGFDVLAVTGFSWSANAFSDALYDLLVNGDFAAMAALFSLQPVTLDAQGARDGVLFHFEDVTSPITFLGSDFDDILGGGLARDTLSGGRGADALFGDRGNDLIRGGSGADSLAGGQGRDTIDGGAGRDVVFYDLARKNMTVDLDAGTATGEGLDTLIRIEHVFGGRFDDLIRGNRADNALIGLAGTDTLLGGVGADSLAGGAGRDRLVGGRDSDEMRGGASRDTLVGGAGDDTLAGGQGDDHFVFRGRIDADTVTDFSKAHDTLVLDDALWGGGLARWKVVRDYATDLGSQVLFDFGGGETILLEDVQSLTSLNTALEII